MSSIGKLRLRSRDFGEYFSVGLPALVSCATALLAITLAGCGSKANNYEQRAFFQKEYGLETHGHKTWFDHLVEFDPGGIKTSVAPEFEENAPLKIAVLPFADRGAANFVVDKIVLTHRDKQQRER